MFPPRTNHITPEWARALADPRSQPSRRSLAFSLIELLVVVAIISVLISILLPTLSKVRNMSIRTECASNMRQCYMDLYMYASDNSGKFPTMGWQLINGGDPPNYWWENTFASTPLDIGASNIVKAYFNNNTAILYCPAWCENTVWYGGSLASLDPSAVGTWWYNYSGSGVPPANGTYPAYPTAYLHILGYAFMCSGAQNSGYIGTNPNLSPPYPAENLTGKVGTPYYISSTKQSGNKVLIADEMCYVGPVGVTGGFGNGWHNWDVAHTTPGNAPNVAPYGANHCNLDGSVTWNVGSEMQEQFWLYQNSPSSPGQTPTNNDFQWWW